MGAKSYIGFLLGGTRLYKWFQRFFFLINQKFIKSAKGRNP
jgi:hypothetical protein